MRVSGTGARQGGSAAMDRATVSSAATLAGIGLAAGLVGSVFMLLGQKAEMAATGREPSDTPAKALETMAQVDPPEDDRVQQRLSTVGHFAFGTSLGLGLAALAKVPEPVRGIAFFAGVWSTGTATLTTLGLSDPPTRWTPQQLATDLAHHAVYAATAAAAFFGLRRLAKV
jgi:hypothetical protein